MSFSEKLKETMQDLDLNQNLPLNLCAMILLITMKNTGPIC